MNFQLPSFVAQFVGSTNIFNGTLRSEGGQQFLEIEGIGRCEVAVPMGKEWAKEGANIFMSVRPEKIDISKTPLEGFSNSLQGTVASIVYHGRSTQYNVRLTNGQVVQVFEQNEEHFPKEVIDYDDTVYFYWQKENVVLLEK